MLNNLCFAKLRVCFEAVRNFHLPIYSGSAIRGAWGHALRHVRPLSRETRCAECPLRAHCQSSELDRYLFQSPAEHPFFFERPRYLDYDLRQFPAPFVLEPPAGGDYRVGDCMEVTWLLIGKAVACVPFLICSWMAMERGRLGRVVGAVRLKEVTSLDPLDPQAPGEKLFPVPSKELAAAIQIADWKRIQEHAHSRVKQTNSLSRLSLKFVTPLRLKNANRLGHVPDFTLLMRSLLRRMTLLSIHSPLFEPIDHKDLLDRSRAVETMTSELHWVDWKRYSSHQKQAMLFGGVVGRITFYGPLWGFEPYLLLGTHFHIGKQATFGLGKYRIRRVIETVTATP